MVDGKKFGDGKWDIVDEGKGRQVQGDQGGCEKNDTNKVLLWSLNS